MFFLNVLKGAIGFHWLVDWWIGWLGLIGLLVWVGFPPLVGWWFLYREFLAGGSSAGFDVPKIQSALIFHTLKINIMIQSTLLDIVDFSECFHNISTAFWSSIEDSACGIWVDWRWRHPSTSFGTKMWGRLRGWSFHPRSIWLLGEADQTGTVLFGDGKVTLPFLFRVLSEKHGTGSSLLSGTKLYYAQLSKWFCWINGKTNV